MSKNTDKTLSAELEEKTSAILGEAITYQVKHWLPTGHLQLDLAVSAGHGIPGGKLVEIYGREAGGKTAIALSIAKQAQDRGGSVIWLDAEAGFSETLARLAGLELEDRFIYRRPETLEKALDAIERLASAAAESQLPTVIVLDSVAALATMAQGIDETSLVKGKRVAPSSAQVMSWFFQRGVLNKIAGSNVYLVFINQVRAKLDYFSYGAPEYSTPGGFAIPFYAAVRVEIKRPGTETGDSDDKKKKVASMIKFKVVKNKVGPPLREGFILLYHKRGFDEAMDQIVYLTARKALQQKGAGRYVIPSIEPDTGYYRKEWRRRWYEEPEVRKAVQELVKKAYAEEFDEQQ